MDRLEPVIRRLLVALNGGGEELASLETAALLARGLSAELAALFVEDIDLLRASRLPLMVEVGGRSARVRELNPDYAARALRLAALRAEARLRRAAEARALTCSFRVTQGKPAAAVLAQADALDAVLLGRRGRAGGRRSVAIWFDAGAEAARALSLAVRIADTLAGPCAVLMPRTDPADFAARTRIVREAAGGRPVTTRSVPGGDPRALAAVLGGMPDSLLVLPAAWAAGGPGRLEELLSLWRGELLVLH